MSALSYFPSRTWSLIRRAHRRRVNRQAGAALLVVTVTVAILAAVVGDLSYNARVELESAANARDQLRAEYLARSGISLARLLIKTQASVLDPINASIHMDLQIGDFAPFLMKAFGGTDGADVISDFLGISASSIKGLGVGKGSTFEVTMVAEDGKINLNCGGGLNPTGGGVIPSPGGGVGPPPAGGSSGTTQALPITNPAQGLYATLSALMWPPRYRRLFETPDSEGQYATADEVAHAILDWSDVDETRFDPMGNSSGGEDYHYDSQRDPYKAHNNYYDTLEELHLVKGVGDDFWGSFGELFTVYGSCKVNLNAVKPEQWPILSAIIRATATDKSNPILADDVMVAALAQQVSAMAAMMGGFQSPSDLAAATKNSGQMQLPDNLKAMLPPGAGSSPIDMSQMFPQIPGMQPVPLDPKALAMLTTTGPRQVYRIDSTGSIQRAGTKRIDVHIRAIFDTKHFNQNTTSGDVNDRMGTWVYWRMD